MNPFQDAFISYGRADSKQFAKSLNDLLVKRDYTVWFDFEDIPLGVDYQKQIDDGINKADNFLFIISPHSVNSPYCRLEIELALKHNKRIIPLLHVEKISRATWQQRNPNGTEADWEEYQAAGKHSSFPNMHPEISKINWIYFRKKQDDIRQSFQGLLDIFQRQRDYVRQHTVLLSRALEWRDNQKQTRYLLVGEDRQQAETWLKRRFKDEQPPCLPTDLHCEFITESIKNAKHLMTQVFLAHAEEDTDVMDKIRRSLRRESFTVWTSQTDIQTGEAFEQAIERGIEQADNLVYLMSPDALQSTYCRKELDYALSLKKRIVPILVRPTDIAQIPETLQQLQYIDLTDNVKEEDYHLDESQLLRLLRQDSAYYDEHKVLLVKALKWERQHRNPSILLRGYNLRHAEAWLKVARQRHQQVPTALHEAFIAASLNQPSAVSLDVFVSYSRTDSDFARQLNDALQLQGKTTWFDQESIASGTDFQQEIYRGIETSDNFLFVLSPNSVKSPYCADEVEYAARLNKRFVTVLHRPVESGDLHPDLARVQWIDFQADFSTHFGELIRTLDTDREHVQSHTKWSNRALEWEQKQRSEDLLLRGNELAIAETWLQETEQADKQPPVTPLQRTWIESGRALRDRTQQEELRRQRKEIHQTRWLAFITAMGGVMMAGLALVVGVVQQKGTRAQIQSQIQLAESQLYLGQNFEAMLSSLRALKMQRWLFIPEEWLKAENIKLYNQALGVLRLAVYNVKQLNQFRSDLEMRQVLYNPAGSSMAVVPDGSSETPNEAGSKKHNIELWTLNGKALANFEGHTQSIRDIAFSPDGQLLISASDDGTARLWQIPENLENQSKKRQGKPRILPGKQLCVAQNSQSDPDDFDPNERFQDDFDPDDPKKDNSKKDDFNGDERPPAQPSPDDFDPDEPNREEMTGVSFSPDGQQFATSSLDGTVRLWNRQCQELSPLLIHRDKKGKRLEVNAVRFSPDGRYLASAVNDGTARLWDRNSRKEIQSFTGHTNQVVWDVGFSPDSQMLATAAWDGTARLWNLQGDQLAQFEHKGIVRDVEFVSVSTDADSYEPDHQHLPGRTVPMLATAAWDGTARLWSLEDKTPTQSKTPSVTVDPLAEFRTRSIEVNSLSVHPKGKRMVTAGTEGIQLWDIYKSDWPVFKGHKAHVNQVRFSPDGQYLGTASKDSTARLWDLFTGIPKPPFVGHSEEVFALDFYTDGCSVLSASDDGMRWWNLAGEEIAKLQELGPVSAFKVSPSGKSLATADVEEYAVRLQILKPGKGRDRDQYEDKSLAEWHAHQQLINDIAFSRDGQTIATAGEDGTARLWNWQTQKQLAQFDPDSPVRAVDLHPEKPLVVTGSENETAYLWNWQGEILQEFLHPEGDVDDLNWVNDVRFSPTGEWIATAGDDGIARLWSLDGEKITYLSGHADSVLSLDFSPDGRYLVTGAADGDARLWLVEKDEDLLRRACDWLQPYLKNPEEDDDRDLCRGISSAKLSPPPPPPPSNSCPPPKQKSPRSKSSG